MEKSKKSKHEDQQQHDNSKQQITTRTAERDGPHQCHDINFKNITKSDINSFGYTFRELSLQSDTHLPSAITDHHSATTDQTYLCYEDTSYTQSLREGILTVMSPKPLKWRMKD